MATSGLGCKMKSFWSAAVHRMRTCFRFNFQKDKYGPLAAFRPAVERLEDRLAPAVTVGLNFTGSSFSESGFIPPDTDGAVGPSHFVELINGRFRVYDKTDGSVVQSKTLDQFWTDAGANPVGGTFDPRIIYDHATNRWFAAALDRGLGGGAANDLLVAVSSSSDPAGGWSGFDFVANPTTTWFADFPQLGLDFDGVYVSVNNFGAGFQSVSIFSFPKSDLLTATPTIANRTTFLEESASTRGFAIQPAVDFGASDGRAALLATASAANRFNRTNIFGAGAAGATLSASVNIAVTTSDPPAAFQPDGTQDLDAGDPRIATTVFEVGDSLWSVHGINSGGRAAIRWEEISEVTNAVLQQGTIADANADFFFPSIAANASGEVVIGFTQSSATAGTGFASAYAVTGTTSSGVTTFGAPMLLKQGVATYHVNDGNGTNRWGDYSATTLDPNNPHAFWTIQEWVSATDQWSTQITQLIFQATTSVTLDGSGNLVIADINGGDTDDTLTFLFDSANSRFVISDPNHVLTTDIPGATGDSTGTIQIPFATVTGATITFDTLAGNDSVSLDWTRGTTTKSIVFTGGDGADTLNLIAGPASGSNLWKITGKDTGNLNTTATFAAVENLGGSSLQDVFRFTNAGKLSGTINGNGGGDFLDFSLKLTPVIVNLATGAASFTTDVQQIQHVIGSKLGKNRLTGNALGNILVAHGGGNLLTAGNGRSLLIGGYGKNTLVGGNADDLLINGRTTYSKPAAPNYDTLQVVFSLWQSGQYAYDQRVISLKAPPTSYRLKVGVTVFVYPGVNGGVGPRLGRGGFIYESTLLGNAGLDWFITNASRTVIDRLTNEITT